jgi:hypothetical protein
MSEQRDEHDAEVEDLDVTPEEGEDVKGGKRPPLSDIVITKPIDKSTPIL